MVWSHVLIVDPLADQFGILVNLTQKVLAPGSVGNKLSVIMEVSLDDDVQVGQVVASPFHVGSILWEFVLANDDKAVEINVLKPEG